MAVVLTLIFSPTDADTVLGEGLRPVRSSDEAVLHWAPAGSRHNFPGGFQLRLRGHLPGESLAFGGLIKALSACFFFFGWWWILDCAEFRLLGVRFPRLSFPS